MAKNQKNSEMIAQRVKEALTAGKTIIDFSDFHFIKSRSVVRTAFKKQGKNIKDFKILMPEEYKKARLEYDRARRENSSKSPQPKGSARRKYTKKAIVTKSDTKPITETPNREKSLRSALTRIKYLQADLDEYKRLLDKQDKELANEKDAKKLLESYLDKKDRKIKKLKEEINSYEELLSEADTNNEGRVKTSDKTCYVCPSCSQKIGKNNVQKINSGHVLLNCPECGKMFAAKPEELIADTITVKLT